MLQKNILILESRSSNYIKEIKKQITKKIGKYYIC
jgi:hypothetical protein